MFRTVPDKSNLLMDFPALQRLAALECSNRHQYHVNHSMLLGIQDMQKDVRPRSRRTKHALWSPGTTSETTKQITVGTITAFKQLALAISASMYFQVRTC
jgi:hypothetical protein